MTVVIGSSEQHRAVRESERNEAIRQQGLAIGGPGVDVGLAIEGDEVGGRAGGRDLLGKGPDSRGLEGTLGEVGVDGAGGGPGGEPAGGGDLNRGGAAGVEPVLRGRAVGARAGAQGSEAGGDVGADVGPPRCCEGAEGGHDLDPGGDAAAGEASQGKRGGPLSRPPRTLSQGDESGGIIGGAHGAEGRGGGSAEGVLCAREGGAEGATGCVGVDAGERVRRGPTTARVLVVDELGEDRGRGGSPGAAEGVDGPSRERVVTAARCRGEVSTGDSGLVAFVTMAREGRAEGFDDRVAVGGCVVGETCREGLDGIGPSRRADGPCRFEARAGVSVVEEREQCRGAGGVTDSADGLNRGAAEGGVSVLEEGA